MMPLPVLASNQKWLFSLAKRVFGRANAWKTKPIAQFSQAFSRRRARTETVNTSRSDVLQLQHTWRIQLVHYSVTSHALVPAMTPVLPPPGEQSSFTARWRCLTPRRLRALFKKRDPDRFERFNIVVAILLAGWVPSILMLVVSYTILTNTLESKILRDRQTLRAIDRAPGGRRLQPDGRHHRVLPDAARRSADSHWARSRRRRAAMAEPDILFAPADRRDVHRRSRWAARRVAAAGSAGAGPGCTPAAWREAASDVVERLCLAGSRQRRRTNG